MPTHEKLCPLPRDQKAHIRWTGMWVTLVTCVFCIQGSEHIKKDIRQKVQTGKWETYGAYLDHFIQKQEGTIEGVLYETWFPLWTQKRPGQVDYAAQGGGLRISPFRQMGWNWMLLCHSMGQGQGHVQMRGGLSLPRSHVLFQNEWRSGDLLSLKG